MTSLRNKLFIALRAVVVLCPLPLGASGGGGFSIPWASVQLVNDVGDYLSIKASPVDHKLEKVLFVSGDRSCSIPSRLMDGVYGVAPEKARLNFSFSIPTEPEEKSIFIVGIVIPIDTPETPRFSADFNAVEYWIHGENGCEVSVEFFAYRNNSRTKRLTKEQVFDFEPW